MTGCVINHGGYFKTFVALTDDGKPIAYGLANGERVVRVSPPATRAYAGALGFVRPRWDGEAWGEGASDDEIAAWKTAHPAPNIPTPAPTQLDRVEAQTMYTALMTDTLLEEE